MIIHTVAAIPRLKYPDRFAHYPMVSQLRHTPHEKFIIIHYSIAIPLKLMFTLYPCGWNFICGSVYPFPLYALLHPGA